MSFDEDVDPFDPVVADRFALLDRATPPAAGGPPSSAAVGDPGLSPEPGRPRALHLLAAAAALVTVGGLTTYALARQGADSDVAATGGDVQLETDGTGELDDQTGDDGVDRSRERLTVEVEPSSSGERADGTAASGDADAGSDDRSPTEPGDDQESSSAETTTTGRPRSGATAATAKQEEAAEQRGTATTTSSATTAATAETTTTTTAQDPTTSWSLVPQAERVVVIRGTVTEVFTDCQSRLVLNSSGEVESISPVSCDGGSYIVVNGNRIQTSSGFGAAGDHYNKHMMGLRPGRKVAVTALPSRSGFLTLECVQCGISLTG